MILERKVERLEGNEWKPIEFSEIKDGDVFRLFDDGPNPIEIGESYKAGSDAFMNGPNNVYAVYTKVNYKM